MSVSSLFRGCAAALVLAAALLMAPTLGTASTASAGDGVEIVVPKKQKQNLRKKVVVRATVHANEAARVRVYGEISPIAGPGTSWRLLSEQHGRRDFAMAAGDTVRLRIHPTDGWNRSTRKTRRTTKRAVRKWRRADTKRQRRKLAVKADLIFEVETGDGQSNDDYVDVKRRAKIR